MDPALLMGGSKVSAEAKGKIEKPKVQSLDSFCKEFRLESYKDTLLNNHIDTNQLHLINADHLNPNLKS